MIPQLLTVRVSRPRGRRVRLWIPLLPVALVLAPLLLLAALAGVIACLVGRINPVRATHRVGQVLCALPGTRIEIEQGRSAVLVTIR
jgi:hypothetical protein